MAVSPIAKSERLLTAASMQSKPSVKAISRNLRDFGSTKAPPNRGGRCPSVTPLMREALLEYLVQKPGLTLEEMVVYLWDDFESRATTSSISRALHTASWSKKKARGIAKGRGADLRDFIYIAFLTSIPIKSSMSTNQAATSGLGSDALGGLPWVLYPSRSPNFTVANDIRFCLHTHKMASCSHVYFRALPTAPF